VLLHPRVEVAVLETARGGILREGLAFDACTVGVVTNISSDHLGISGINTVEELARVKQVVVEAVDRNGAAVLNADDPLVAEMAAATDADVVYFSTNLQQHIVQAHLAEGGRCVVVNDNTIVLATGQNQVELVELDRVAFASGGKIRFQVANALAATAAAWAAGLNPAMIARALTTFTSDSSMVPGRFNITELHGVELVMDYGHNEAAMKALGEAVLALGNRKTVMALALPGDRRDEDLAATIKATIPFVDEYVMYDLDDLRGRTQREVPNLLQRCLPEHCVCTMASDQHEAMIKGWQAVQPGDRMVVIVDKVDEALAQLRSLAESITEDAACYAPISAEVGAW
jgi:cyanophycin synthetase